MLLLNMKCKHRMGGIFTQIEIEELRQHPCEHPRACCHPSKSNLLVPSCGAQPCRNPQYCIAVSRIWCLLAETSARPHTLLAAVAGRRTGEFSHTVNKLCQNASCGALSLQARSCPAPCPWYACQQVLLYKPVSVLPCHRLPYRPSPSEEAPFPRFCMLALRPCAVCCKHDLP